MNEERHSKNDHDRFAEKVARKEARRLKARDERDRGLFYGLGMFGLVGWSVAIPALLLLALGIWIDARSQSRYSWTLMLLVLGIGIGCMNAWFWVSRESKNE